MEVNHEAMNNAGNATAPTSARPREPSNAMEHDPSSAPQIVDPTNPPMSFRSGAVPDQYESYPEVMPPQGLGPPSAYPQSAQTISPVQPGGSYDRYAISPPPPGQNQPLMQNAQYGQAPNAAEAEKSYYQPTYGVSQPPPPTPYSNANTLIPDQHTAAPSYDKVGGAGATLPPPVAYSPPAGDGEKKILGMKKKTFWIVLIVVIILILAGIGGAVGGVLSSKDDGDGKNDNNDNLGSDRGNGTRGGGGDNGGTYTPYALTTGQRTLNLRYSESRGSCNDPDNLGGSGVIDCFATSTYIVRIDGSVKDGYTLSSVDVQGSTFSNVRGTPPTTSDPNEPNSGWAFEVSFTQGGSCATNRLTKYVFGMDENIYAIGEAFSLRQQCSKQTGEIFAAGTACTCVGISTTAE
ncbi:hypothetical protein TWF106_006637 [Orbilia oligospora]|uniref:Uncharacterized protein n=2 Tax=Orbilia oligospora TaxID=2813651 RepID=A0A6G1M342_ORBOL|nr:hypothetical protein TWF106_006637 [Orbilia oligospora]KAF3243427.1 hypothetical protein TWF192_008334 [Orbilia oligospora]